MTSYEDAVRTYREICDRADYVNAIAKNILGEPYGKGEISGVSLTGVEFGYEYNTACNCHPEYSIDTYELPAEWLDPILSWEEVRALVEAEQVRRVAAKEKELQEKAEQKAKAEEAVARLLEIQQREQYEMLRAKFEPQQQQ